MSQFLRANIRAMTGYTPGEQPRGGNIIKLNTNENPYPPSPRVFEAIRQALTGDRLRKYPDPVGTEFRRTAGRVLGVDPESILPGNVIVTRSLSKSYALAGVRFGFAVADPALIRELIKVKDSYNCDAFSQAAATAALEDQAYLQSTRAKILATRARMTTELRRLGF